MLLADGLFAMGLSCILSHYRAQAIQGIFHLTVSIIFFVFSRNIQRHDERWIVTCDGVVSSGNGLLLAGGRCDR
jgi:hypothetical protein